MTTAEIVETLRDEARGWQRSAGRNPKVHLHGGQVGMDIIHRMERDKADALRRAAKRLSRLADDEFADRVAVCPSCRKKTYRESCDICRGREAGIDAYRRANGAALDAHRPCVRYS
jgi:hypothetical protein